MTIDEYKATQAAYLAQYMRMYRVLVAASRQEGTND